MNWLTKLFRRAQNDQLILDGVQPELERDDGALGEAAISSDNPIKTVEDDTLGRAAVAEAFVRQVLSLDARQELVVGILGLWGSGKTSFINLARTAFAEASVRIVDFNPWMFSGTEQLVNSFFVELAAQLKLSPGLAEIAASLELYGERFSKWTWIPIVGDVVDVGQGASKMIGDMMKRRAEGIGGPRNRLIEALSKLDTRFIVVIDDVDRLSSQEIREIFKLVRLTASFPNIIYLLSFDRSRVETALSEQGVPGRAYLEKILQVAIDLPAIPDDVMNQQIFQATDQALSDIAEPGPFDQHAWPDVFMEIIRPLIHNMRDVRRYALAINGTVDSLSGQIELVDVLALEAIRTFLPDIYARLHSAVEGLTTTSGLRYGEIESPALRSSIEDLISASEEHSAIVQSMIRLLFPAASRFLQGGSHYGAEWNIRWLRERRVAHRDILTLYLERVAGHSFRAFIAAEHAMSLMNRQDEFDAYLRSQDLSHLEEIISSLEHFEDEFQTQHAIPGITVLLNLLPDLPQRTKGMFDLGTRLVVGRVILRLLRKLPNQDEVERVARIILPDISSLSAKLELITDLGYRKNAGHKLVSESAAAELERAWRDEVRVASTTELLRERYPLSVLMTAKREAAEGEHPLEIPDSPDLTLALLRAAKSEQTSQALGSRAVRRYPMLAWDGLVELWGDEEELKRRIDKIGEHQRESDEALFALVERYLGGWQPGQFPDE